MSRLGLLLLLLGAAAASPAGCRHGAGGIGEFYKRIRDFSESDENPFKEDLDDHEHQMNQVAVRLAHIYAEADKAVKAEAKWATYLDDLEAEVETLEGTHCGWGEFNCHDGMDTCVDKILACDGHKDCSNGYDENNHTCFNPFEEGSVWNGKMVYDHCTQRQPTVFRITIIEEHLQDHFPSDDVITADIYLAGDDIVDHFHVEANFRVHGDYYFGTRQLILQPPEADRLGILVQYDGHHNKDATAWVVREASMEKCAEIHLHREN